MMPWMPPMMLVSMVGHAIFHTADRSGPSMMERSYFRPPGAVGAAGGAGGTSVASAAGGTTDTGASVARRDIGSNITLEGTLTVITSLGPESFQGLVQL